MAGRQKEEAAQMSADDFTKHRLAWLEAISEDCNATGSAKSVAIKIATKYLSRTKGCAWPGIATLADDLHLSRFGVQKAVRLLEGLGWLHIETGGGRKLSNRYRVAFQKQPTTVAENSQPQLRKQPTTVGPTPLMSPSREPIERGHSRANGAFLAKRHRKLSQTEIRDFQEKVSAIVDNGDMSADATFLRLTTLIAKRADFDEEGCLERVEQFADGWEPATEYRELYVFLQGELQLSKRKRQAEEKQTDGLRQTSKIGA
jgi:DNA-binding transcriptional MocR family regulator